jgi:hypothetical protein
MKTSVSLLKENEITKGRQFGSTTARKLNYKYLNKFAYKKSSENFTDFSFGCERIGK